MKNQKIRLKMLEAGLRQWELARLLGVGESVLSRKLRDELDPKEQAEICALIDQAKGGENGEK